MAVPAAMMVCTLTLAVWLARDAWPPMPWFALLPLAALYWWHRRVRDAGTRGAQAHSGHRDPMTSCGGNAKN